MSKQRLKSDLIKDLQTVSDKLVTELHTVSNLQREVKVAKDRLKDSNDLNGTLIDQIEKAKCGLRVYSLSQNAEAHRRQGIIENEGVAPTCAADNKYYALREIRMMLGDYSA